MLNEIVMLTSNLGWNWSLIQFLRRFLSKVSVSSPEIHGSQPSENLCISLLCSGKSNQEPKTTWIWSHTSFNSCEHQQ